MNIILKSVLLDESECDILIKGNKFAKISSKNQKLNANDFYNANVVDCKNLAIMPPFYNAHTHAAMTLLRGFADDMPLKKWLNEYIWPFESKLIPKDIEIGTRLAVLEMIKSGTVFFADMYWHREATAKVVEEMGIRAAIGVTIAENLDSKDHIKSNFKFLKEHKLESERIQLAVMPHSIYTVGENIFKQCVKIASSENYILHTHLCETKSEVFNCKKEIGCSPVELMERYGALHKNFVAAHCVHMSKKDIELMTKSNSFAALNVCSNLKLCSGIPKIAQMYKSKMQLCLGTDGASSNNNLDMLEEMKFASLLAKSQSKAEDFCAADALKLATVNGARAYNINAGVIKEGALADAIFIDLKNERMVPRHNILSNWVYSADSSAINSVMCNGNFVMQNHKVDGEKEILADAISCANSLAKK